jgi:hypothetical protein
MAKCQRACDTAVQMLRQLLYPESHASNCHVTDRMIDCNTATAAAAAADRESSGDLTKTRWYSVDRVNLIAANGDVQSRHGPGHVRSSRSSTYSPNPSPPLDRHFVIRGSSSVDAQRVTPQSNCLLVTAAVYSVVTVVAFAEKKDVVAKSTSPSVGTSS